MKETPRASGATHFILVGLGVIIALLVLLLAAGGVKLAGLGGSWYFLIGGLAMAIAGVLIARCKKAGAWLMEKAGRLKLGGTGEGELSRLEALEALGIGIQGKLALWRGLQRVATRHPALAGVDLPGLERQGRAQWERVEAHRVEAALQAL